MEQGKEIRERAQFFLNNKIKAFLKDNFNSYYWGYIVQINDLGIKIKNEEGKRLGKYDFILWCDLRLLIKYKEIEEMGDKE